MPADPVMPIIVTGWLCAIAVREKRCDAHYRGRAMPIIESPPSPPWFRARNLGESGRVHWETWENMEMGKCGNWKMGKGFGEMWKWENVEIAKGSKCL